MYKIGGGVVPQLRQTVELQTKVAEIAQWA